MPVGIFRASALAAQLQQVWFYILKPAGVIASRPLTGTCWGWAALDSIYPPALIVAID